MSDLLEQTKHAIIALQKPDQTQNANLYLTSFFESYESWDICVRLLSEESDSFNFFGAISLYKKIQRDFVQLTKEQSLTLFQTLINFILNKSNKASSAKYCRYICLSVAAMAVQMNSPGIVQQILLALNPIIAVNPLLLLEQLTTLPEECFNYRTIVSDDYRDQFAKELSSNITDILNFLQYVFQNSNLTGSDRTDLNQIVLKCLENWIVYTDITADLLEAHPIFYINIECLKNEDTFENAVEVLIAVCRKYELQYASSILLKTILPHTLSLESLWDNQVSQIERLSIVDDDCESQSNVCRSICRLVTELSESCIDFQFYDTQEGQPQLLLFMMKCVSFRYDFSISRIPLKFFYDLSLLMKSHRRDKAATFENRLSSIFECLIEVIIREMSVPQAVIMGESRLTDSMEDKRHELIETIIDCKMAMGAKFCVKVFCNLLQRETSGMQNWSTIESILYASTSVIFDLTREDSHLCSEIIMFVGLLPDFPGLKLTSINLISKSSGWLRENELYLPKLLSYICTALTVPEIQLQAAKAIATISKHCCKANGFPKEEIFSIFEQNKVSKILSTESETYLIEGLCYIVGSLPAQTANDCLEYQILGPLVQSLHTNLQIQPCTQNLLLSSVDLISSVFRFIVIDSQAILVTNFLKLHTLLGYVVEMFPCERVCEKVCRLYKYGIKCIGSALLPHLTIIIEYVTTSYKKFQFSSFIYLGAISFSSFVHEENGQFVQAIYGMLFQISENFLQSMNSLVAFEKRPDLVEEFFFFIARALEYCPVPLLQSSCLHPLIQTAITGLKLQHRDSQKAVLSFFEKLFETARVSHVEIICICASPVVQTLVHSLAGMSQAYALDETYGSVTDTLWIIRQASSSSSFSSWISEAINCLPDNKKRIATTTNFLNISAMNSKYEFTDKIKEFEFRCRDNQFG